jgi:large subunit ribosomal protein L3
LSGFVFMTVYIKGKKIKMGQIFREDKVIPVTLVQLETDKKVDFSEGEAVKVSGRAKGRGFQGVIKRHGFAGGPKSHGQKKKHRSPGSIGATGPQRVLPGTKMAGRLGGNTVTIRNLKVAAFDKKRNLLMIKGALPGSRGSLIKIYKL